MSVIHQFNTGVNLFHNDKISYAPHLHDDAELVVLFGGKAVAIVGGKEYTMEDGDAAVIFPNVVHSFAQVSEKVETGKFIFSADELPELKGELFSDAPDNPIVKADVMQKNGLIRLAREVLSEYDFSSVAVRKAYLTLLTGKLLALPSLADRRKVALPSTGAVSQIVDYCKNNFRENITVSAVAKAVFVSEGYVSRVFSDKLKIGFRAYINGLRLNYAVKLLSENNLTVTEVAFESGFSCLRTFNRVFFETFGCSPKKYVTATKTAIKK